MSQPFLIEPQYWSVSELTSYLRDIFETDANLQDLWVQGEVSNFSHPRSGHIYFSIKDSESTLRCVMWRNNVLKLDFLPRDGQAVEVHGAINIYAVQGQYQMYADIVRPIGEGALYQEFLRLKDQLESEGLFSQERKRPIPHLPTHIGLITSPTGAAIRDIINTLKRRFPMLKVTLAPSLVQGAEAPRNIIDALTTLNNDIRPEVIILARGGGSIEDLWAFNDEGVARAIAGSLTPVITGVGHETDFTIADFVSDLRAPTPTAAAELATPNRTEIITEIMELSGRIILQLRRKFEGHRQEIANLEHITSLKSPITTIHTNRQRLDALSHLHTTSIQQHIMIQRAHLEGSSRQLISLNPLSILERGYAAISKKDGKLVKSIQHVQPDERLRAQLSDGRLGISVEDIIENPNDTE